MKGGSARAGTGTRISSEATEGEPGSGTASLSVSHHASGFSVGTGTNRSVALIGYKAAEIRELKENGRRSEEAPAIIRTVHKPGTEAAPLRGLFAANVGGRDAVVEYEPDTDLRDTEQIPLQEEGGIEAFLRREVLPYAADAWYQADSVKVGYEISFTRYFYKPKPMRTLTEIRADILALERETEGLLAAISGPR